MRVGSRVSEDVVPENFAENTRNRAAEAIDFDCIN